MLSFYSCGGNFELSETAPSTVSLNYMQSINKVTIDGQITKNEINFIVYLPTRYFEDSTKYFPVVYHLHGLGDQYNGSQVKTLSDFLENTWNEGIWEEAIIVFPDGKNNSMWSDSFDGRKRVETNIIYEIIPYVDSSFRTLAQAKYRFIQGFSMGGFGAMKLIGKYPNVFGKAISFDGALHNWNTLSKTRASIAAEIFNNDRDFFEKSADPEFLILPNFEKFRTEKRLHLNYGDMKIVQQFNARSHDNMNEHKILHDYVYSNCEHDLNCIIHQLGRTLFHFYE